MMSSEWSHTKKVVLIMGIVASRVDLLGDMQNIKIGFLNH